MQSASMEVVAPRSTSLQYRPAIDGLRAVAVLAVFLFHLDRRLLPGGFVGVDIFFVISGYLITSIIVYDCERERFSFSRFYQRRIARLLPAFFIVGLATLAGASLIYSKQDLASAGANLASAAGSIANLKLMFQGSYFVLSPDAQPFLHCWSLSVEEQFYLFFPALVVVLYKTVPKQLPRVLIALWAVSFVACVILTRTHPEWAFYLLPTRAWELLTGSIAATVLAKAQRTNGSLLSVLGLAMVALSFYVISEHKSFPGYWAAIPVLGAGGILSAVEAPNSFVERALSWRPMVVIGRGSYSLYLWHWPIFCLIDYGWFQSSPWFRISMKVLISAAAATLCYVFVEKPSRSFLNSPARKGFAFAALACSLVTLVPAGIAVRQANYVDASLSDVVHGGRHFNQAATGGSILLMGDSNGAMYGKTMTEVAKEQNLKLTVIGVPAGDPLPHSSGEPSELWFASLNVVKRERPDIVVFACNWSKLDNDRDRLAIALKELTPFARRIIVLTKPAELPPRATREGIRAGARPPFFENPAERTRRLQANGIVKNASQDRVSVLDIENLFSTSDGRVDFLDDRGEQLYHDFDHLSYAGAELVKNELLQEIRNTAR